MSSESDAPNKIWSMHIFLKIFFSTCIVLPHGSFEDMNSDQLYFNSFHSYILWWCVAAYIVLQLWSVWSLSLLHIFPLKRICQERKIEMEAFLCLESSFVSYLLTHVNSYQATAFHENSTKCGKSSSDHVLLLSSYLIFMFINTSYQKNDLRWWYCILLERRVFFFAGKVLVLTFYWLRINDLCGMCRVGVGIFLLLQTTRKEYS